LTPARYVAEQICFSRLRFPCSGYELFSRCASNTAACSTRTLRSGDCGASRRRLTPGYIWLIWFGTKDTGLTGAKDFSEADKEQNPTLYILCKLEKPVTLAVIGWATETQIRAAYDNAGIPRTVSPALSHWVALLLILLLVP
jgi:hypothetical protein